MLPPSDPTYNQAAHPYPLHFPNQVDFDVAIDRSLNGIGAPAVGFYPEPFETVPRAYQLSRKRPRTHLIPNYHANRENHGVHPEPAAPLKDYYTQSYQFKFPGFGLLEAHNFHIAQSKNSDCEAEAHHLNWDHIMMDAFSPEPPLSVSSAAASPAGSIDTQGLGPATNGGPSIGSGVSNGDARSASQGPLPTVPAACLACRGKHLKCDGITPCSRCRSSNSECVYVASRRGYKGPRRSAVPHNPNKRHASSSPPGSESAAGATVGSTADDNRISVNDNSNSNINSSSNSNSAGTSASNGGGSSNNNINSNSNTNHNYPMLLGASPGAGSIPGSMSGSAFPGTPASTAFATPPALAHLELYRNPFATHGASGLDPASLAIAGASPAAPVATTLADRCLDSFYYHFHASHPFVLPKEFLQRLIKEGTTKLDHLVAAIRYVGSLYLDAGPARAAYLDEAVRLAYLPGCPKDGFLVQTLLLLIIGLDGSCSQARANSLLADCERIAVEISINSRRFATTNGRGNPVLEESWRRTWWELYVVDGMIAGVHRVTSFLLFDIASDVALPCEEHQFLSGNIPMPMYMEDFDDRLFSGEDREFSSFAYRIAAARNLGRFMRTPPMLFPEDENIAKIESLLTNWRMHLPQSKKDALNKNCQLDEMMFQALFINHACTILLHQPHSQLDSTPARTVTSCAPHTPVPSGEAFNAHTRHTITAACEISRMVTHAVPLLSHTHFFTCVVTLSSIVHLSKWALYFIQDEDDLRQQIRLNIGALQRCSEVWRNAETASRQVKGVAQEIYRAKKAQQINPAFWVAFTQEQMLSSLNADEEIMSDFDAILPVAQVSQP